MLSLTQPLASSTRGHRLRLGPTAAFLLLASTIVSFLAASSASTPLCATYQAKWDLSGSSRHLVVNLAVSDRAFRAFVAL